MSLSVALQVAQSALAARQSETATVSRNITGAQDPGYTRKTTLLSTLVTSSGQSGGVKVEGIGRTTNKALFLGLLDATSIGSSQQAILNGLVRMEETIDDTQLELSPAAYLGNLETAIQQFSSDPSDTILAQRMLDASYDMVNVLNSGTAVVQKVRADADADIAQSVETINELLANLESLNTIIVKGTQSGSDVTDALDSRDQVLLSLSEEVGIRTLTRENQDVVVFTDSGLTLFETSARAVNFDATNTYAAGTTGNAVFIDGVAVTGDNAMMPISSGRLYGLSVLRDDVATTYQGQLDEIARGLIEAFAESDQVAAGPDQAGLFTWSGAPAIPVTGTVTTGLAADIQVNANVDPSLGGNLDLLRDGGISDPLDPNYDYNAGDLAGFSGRLQEVLTAFDEPRTFDPSVGTDPTNTLKGFSSTSVSWLESQRKDATGDAERQSVIVARTAEALSNDVGVNIDEEMTRLLDIERAYGAAAKLIATVDSMLDDLFATVR